VATNLDDIDIIRTHFLNEWDNAVPVVFDNDPASPKPEGIIWARLSVRPTAETRKSIASRTYEQKGWVYLQVMVPDGLSDHDGYALTETFKDTFRDWSSPDFRIRFATPDYSTSHFEGEQFTIKVSIPYRAQH
jgi:hypothetical protein